MLKALILDLINGIEETKAPKLVGIEPPKDAASVIVNC